MRPCLAIGIQCADSFLCLAVRGQISQMHVVIALAQERIAQRTEHPWFIAAEVVREDEV